MRIRDRRRFAGALVLVSACLSESAGPDAARPALIDAASVEAGPHNVLSAVVLARLRDADSAAVRFRLDEPAGGDSATPAARVVDGAATIPVLGLLPDRRYLLRVIVYGARDSAVGTELTFTTDALPSDLPAYTASGTDPSPGYVVFAAGRYGLVIDNTGRVVWYRRFSNGAGLAFMAEPTGRYVVRPPTPEPADLEPWMELDPLGNVTRTLGCLGGFQPRPHDIITEADGAYWIMCDETRSMDLSALGGVTEARVTGTVVQHIGAGGELRFHWSPFDHFAITDLEPADRVDANVNWTHGNALDLDADGGLILSSRSLGEITKIDVTTGNVIWRMGGRRNEFTFLDTSMPAFARQHSARACGPGALLLLDNLGDPVVSRAERYAVDERTRTARLVHSYASIPGVVTQIGGSAQDLPSGRTLVSFGTAGRVEEYDAEGRVVWRIDGNPGYVFRAQRVRSLYRPGAGSTR